MPKSILLFLYTDQPVPEIAHLGSVHKTIVEEAAQMFRLNRTNLGETDFPQIFERQPRINLVRTAQDKT